MPTLRVRTGCLTCRRRRKKCDERKPLCRGCERNNLSCHWPHPDDISRRRGPNAVSRAPVSQKTAPRASELRHTSTGLFSRQPQQLLAASFDDESGSFATSNDPLQSCLANLTTTPDPDPPQDQIPLQTPSPSDSSAPSPLCSNSSASPTSAAPPELPVICLAADEGFLPGGLPDFSFLEEQTPFILGDDAEVGLATNTAAQAAPSPRSPLISAAINAPTPSIPRSVSILPGMTGASFELLSHYLGTTSLSMDNGSASANPFTVLLIPLAFSSDLVLHLLLTQSAVHRASRLLADTRETASEYYTRSLQLFQKNITKYNGRQRLESLNLTVGALIMCFVETARGDINGTVFDHLMAAHWLLLASLSDTTSLWGSLKDFLVEYYVYTATLSMVSIDTRVSPQFLLGDELKAHVQNLISNAYVGSLCGCWLELLLQIPAIFNIGRRFLAETEAARPITADDFAIFASEQRKIESWSPNPAVHHHVAMCGRIFQKAMLVYLYTTLQTLPGAANGKHSSAVQNAVSEALSYLEEIPPTARINTSLCWPIAIVGSCTTDKTQRDVLRTRLDTMFAAIGLGNIQQTGFLLNLVWGTSSPDPWNICRVMQEHQMWISFA